LQHEQPPLYDSLTKSLTQDERTVIQGVINQAEANAVALAAAHAQDNGGVQ
jgi:hypothetical protein